ncbi:MAG: ATP-binding protein [Pseudomonadota bacterium]|nr:ATP-binding protein [Pseudomonadota bacterium]
MLSRQAIIDLLQRLEKVVADDLEGQEIDFKEWDARSKAKALDLLVEMAVCMANGGGGTVVFGVRDKVIGRAQAIVGIPPEIDINILARTVYDETDPKLTPEFEELTVPEGTGRLLLMHVRGMLKPYTTTAGLGKIRVGRDCMPLTGSQRATILVETGESDLTAQTVDGPPETLISPAAMEILREVARQESAPGDLLTKTDLDLLAALELIVDGRLTRAGVFLGGSEKAIERHLPNYLWTHLRMVSDTDYQDRADGRQALAQALTRLEDRINADNPITTVEHGLYHFEYRAYPARALREALMNALCHADFTLASPVLVKQFPNRLEIANPGGFIGGITPGNILNHAPVARNPALVAALARLRLVNRSNLGVGRMFEAMLIEGKEPPTIENRGGIVRVGFLRQEVSAPFRAFIADEGKSGRVLPITQLLVLRYLLAHAEADTATLAALAQREEGAMLSALDEMGRAYGYIERGGAGRGTWWRIAPHLHRQLAGPGHPERDQRIEWEAAKTRVLSVLMERARRGEPGLTNGEVRAITRQDRQQVNRLIHELETEGVRLTGHARGARYVYAGPPARQLPDDMSA